MDGRECNSRINLQKEVKIPQSIINTLIKHSKNTIPNESCALLFGDIEDKCVNVKDVFLTKNIENSSVYFTISNEELLKGYQEAEKRNLNVVAIFHSHPDSDASPSHTDQKYMHTNPVPWIIFSNKKEDLKAYIFDSKIISLLLTIQ